MVGEGGIVRVATALDQARRGAGKVFSALVVLLLLASALVACVVTKSSVIYPLTHGGTLTTPSSRPPGTGCPPGAESAKAPVEGDTDIDGNGSTDLLMGSYHWDDGYYDLTVEVWCMGSAYFSQRISESVNGTDYVKIAPGRTEAEGRNNSREC